jgi:hypothetical protein
MKKTRSRKSRDTVPLSGEGTLKIKNNIPCAKGGHDPLKSRVSFVSRNVGRHVQKKHFNYIQAIRGLKKIYINLI